MSRIDATFSACKQANRAALVTYIMAHDPDANTTKAVLPALVDAGADIIELGMPFSDPSADGPTIQAAAGRALATGGSVANTLDIVREFRASNDTTPIILMGYYNPVLHYGIETFVRNAVAAGVDGVILVDLTPEEEAEFVDVSEPTGLAHIKLTAPTTTVERAKTVLKRASGFVYYISVAGITGGKSAQTADIEVKLNELREVTNLPIAVGFGIKTPEQAASVGAVSDAIVVGSSIVQLVADNAGDAAATVAAVKNYVSTLSCALV